ncbi:MAG: hypothetical protein JW709_11825 [Sedimentisphaerales bacterium]|nr:hypothetical protein [Sedimentisphaerales bacterium]
MGSWYDSISLYQADAGRVRECVIGWLERRNFEVKTGPSYLELDQEAEREVWLYSNDQWCIVLYSHYEEEERLVFELNKCKAPLLHLWLADSDVWGYELDVDGETISAFNSNPRYYGREQPAAGPNDIDALCGTCGKIGSEWRIESIQRRWRFFKEKNCIKFAQVMGMRPAASAWNYAGGEITEQECQGFKVEHLCFQQAGYDPMAGFDLHKIRVRDGKPRPVSPEPNLNDMVDHFGEAQGKEIYSTILFWQKFFGFFRFVLTPLISIISLLFRIYFKLFQKRMPSKMNLLCDKPDWIYCENGVLINKKHGCRVVLGEGALNKQKGFEYGFMPMVFYVDISGYEIYCRALNPEAVKMMLDGPLGNKILTNEDWWVGSFPAKTILTTNIDAEQSLFMLDHFIQTPQAVYQFRLDYKDEIDNSVLAEIKDIVSSFELIGQERQRDKI